MQWLLLGCCDLTGNVDKAGRPGMFMPHLILVLNDQSPPFQQGQAIGIIDDLAKRPTAVFEQDFYQNLVSYLWMEGISLVGRLDARMERFYFK